MNLRQMDKFIAHCDHYFGQKNTAIFHMVNENAVHIDVLLYEPNENYPFWKLVTMGASDYTMPKKQTTFGFNNEYVMFVHKSVDLKDENVLDWYLDKLSSIGSFAYDNQVHITYGNSFDVKIRDEEEMVCCFIELPQIIRNSGFLRCKVSFFKTIICLQAVLLNKDEFEKLTEIGAENFSYWLYPENKENEHFIVERVRSEKF